MQNYLNSITHYVQIHTEDSIRICQNMFVKLKNVVLVIKKYVIKTKINELTNLYLLIKNNDNINIYNAQIP